MSLPRVDFPSLGWQVIDWIETNLCHGPGDVQGTPIVLDDELARFICWAYRLDESGGRTVRRAVLSRPKGRAKSELAGMLVCAEALGPVRFDGWDTHGQPVGRAVTAPFIRCLATEEGQSGHTYSNVVAMLEHARDQHGVSADIGLTRVFLPAGGEIRPSTASSTAKDGGKETFCVADEIHLYTLQALRQMHRTVRRNLGKRKAASPWLLDTTTAFLPGEESIAREVHTYVERVGFDAAAAAGLLYDYRCAHAISDWYDDSEMLAALRDVYGPAAAWMDMPRLLAEIRDPHADPADSCRYWLNQIVASSDQWLGLTDWEARAASRVTVQPGERIALGFDGSKWDDSTALVGCRLSDGHLFVVGVWEKPDGAAGHGWEVPRHEVDAAVHEAFARFTVARMYVDPPYWQEELDAWHAMFGDGVAAWWTHRDTQMARALERLHTAVLDGALTHDSNRVLAAHVANARRKKTRAGVVIRKDRPKSPNKIDAAVAATLAFEARADALAAGALKPVNKTVVFL